MELETLVGCNKNLILTLLRGKPMVAPNQF